MCLCLSLAASLAAVANPIINDCWISYCFASSNSAPHSAVYVVTTEKQKLLVLCVWLAGKFCLTTYMVHIKIQGLLAVRMSGGVLTSQSQPPQIF